MPGTRFSPAGFAAWVSRLVEQEDPATPPSAQSSAGTRPVPNGVCPELSDMQQPAGSPGACQKRAKPRPADARGSY
jgi:hypothetical protein